MKNTIIRSLFLLAFLLPVIAFAQTNGKDFSEVDDYVKKLGNLDSMSMGSINNVVSRKFPEKIDRARAIFDWIAMNITYDVKTGRSNIDKKNTATEILKSRRAAGAGFATLFQDMCSAADIRCLTVDGFLKTNHLQIGDKSTDINHTWAVVQLGESPDTWFYVDPAMGSGYLEADMKTFTQFFNTGYFFTEKNLFNWDHYPYNDAWKLGSAPKNRGDFFDLPVIRNAAYEYGLKSFSPRSGKTKAKVGKSVNYQFRLNAMADISSVTMIIGEKKKIKTKDIPFNFSGGTLSFSNAFDVENSYPVTIKVNGKELIIYEVDVE